MEKFFKYIEQIQNLEYTHQWRATALFQKLALESRQAGYTAGQVMQAYYSKLYSNVTPPKHNGAITCPHCTKEFKNIASYNGHRPNACKQRHSHLPIFHS